MYMGTKKVLFTEGPSVLLFSSDKGWSKGQGNPFSECDDGVDGEKRGGRARGGQVSL